MKEDKTLENEDLLALCGPRAAVIVDGAGRVERIVHRERPNVDIDQPLTESETVASLMAHEVRESLLYGGKRVLDPHRLFGRINIQEVDQLGMGQ